MTRPANACSLKPSQPGFTLIEMLVVVLIIGIVLSFVSLSLNPTSNADRLDHDAQALQARVSAAADDALLYGREIGLDITRGGYRFLQLGDDGWQPVARRDSPLRPRQLGDGIVLALLKQDKDQPQLVSAPGDDDDKDQAKAVRPEAVFLSSGEMVPFILELYADGVDHRFQLTGKANGDLTLERLEDRR